MSVATDFSKSLKNQSLSESSDHRSASDFSLLVPEFSRNPLNRCVRMISYSTAILSLQLSAVAMAQAAPLSLAQSAEETSISADQTPIEPQAGSFESPSTEQPLSQTSTAEQIREQNDEPDQIESAAADFADRSAGTKASTLDMTDQTPTAKLPQAQRAASIKPVNQEAEVYEPASESSIQDPVDTSNQGSVLEDPESQTQGIDPSLYLPELTDSQTDTENPTPVEADKPPFYKRLYNRFFGDEIGDVNYIKVETKINQTEQVYSELALELLARNVEEALIQVTEEDLMLGKSIFPRLRGLANEAAQAVGFYESKFNFQIVDSNELFVIIDAGAPVLIIQSTLGAGPQASDNKDIKQILDTEELAVGKIFNHGFYSTTKASLIQSLEDNGFFEKRPIETDVEIVLPDNTADINLIYDSGPRYEFGEVSFVNTDGKDYTQSDLPNQIELTERVLKQLITFEPGEKFTQAQLDRFLSNLLNTKYFNGVDLQILKPRSASDDVTSTQIAPETSAEQAQNEQKRQVESSESEAMGGSSDQISAQSGDLASEESQSDSELTEQQSSENQKVVDALKDPVAGLELSDLDAYSKKLERNLTPDDLQRPVVVVLDSSNPNSAEVGLGYGTDTGVRARAQYNQNLLNSRGHSATANIELSQVNQRIELGYRIPLSSPITDSLKFTLGYELEDLSRGSKDLDVKTQTYVLGVNRDLLKDNWRHTPSVFYRLYELESKISQIDQDLLPDRFRASLGDQSQEALLFGYRLERSDYQGGLSPYQGFKRYVSAEVGSESLLTDVNMAILRGGVAGLYSFGTLNEHQVLARFDTGAILTPSFQDVPYKLRFFAGGDRSIRGFDYQSLSPELGGFLYGGETLAVGSLEYNYRFKPKIRGALFADAGNAYEKNFSGDTELGMGFGVRYDSPVGPLRVDIAAGVSDPDLPIRLHFFIGPPL